MFYDFNLLILVTLFFLSYYEFYFLFKDNGYILNRDNRLGFLYVLPYEKKNIEMIKLTFNSLYRYPFPIGEFVAYGFTIYFSIIAFYFYYETHIKYYLLFAFLSFLHFAIPYYLLYMREYKRFLSLGFRNIEEWLDSKYSKIDIKDDEDELVFLSSNKCKFKISDNLKINEYEKYMFAVNKTLNCIGIASIYNLFDEEKTKKYFHWFFMHINNYNFFIVDKYEQAYIITIDNNKVYVREISFDINRKYFSFYNINNIYHSILARLIESLFLVSFFYFYNFIKVFHA